MTTVHLTPEELQKFRSRNLSAKDFSVASRHLQGCETCARLLREVWSGRPITPALAAEIEHLTYEQMSSVLDQSATPNEREWVDDHSRVCPPCARQLRDLQELDAHLSTPAAAVPAARREEPRQATERHGWSFWAWANGALAAALVLILVVGVTLSREGREGSTAASSAPVASVPVDSTSVIAALVIGVGAVFALLLVMSRRRQHKERKRRR